jgi:O-antigen/teichoic acid export membrane protein
MASATDATCVVSNSAVLALQQSSDHSQPIKPLSLKRNALWTMVGTGTYAATQWLQIAIVAHTGTSTDVGRYALALGVCTPVFMFFNLQLRQIQATDSLRKYSFPDYLGMRLLCSACAFILVCILACSLFPSVSIVGLAVLLGLFKVAESISDIYQGLLQQHERMDYVGRSLVVKSGLILSAFGGIYYGSHSLLCAVAAMVGAQLTGLLIYDVRASYRATRARRSETWLATLRTMAVANFQPATLRRLGLRALPLGIAMMLISLYSNLPRFVLNKYVGASGVGVFAAINYISMIGGLLVTAVGTAITPRLSQYAHGNKSGYRQLLGRLVLLGAALGCVGVAGSLLFGSKLLYFLYGAEYARHADVLIWTMVAAGLSYVSSAFGFGATALGRFAGQPWIVAGATAVLLLSVMVLVPSQGLVGAAIAIVISTLICLCGYMTLVFWKHDDNNL